MREGGVVKTTTAVNLSAALTLHNKKVLIVDMDAQANSNCSVGVDENELDVNIYDLLNSRNLNKEDICKAIIKTSFDNLYILPSDITLSNAEITLENALSRERILSKSIKKIHQL